MNKIFKYEIPIIDYQEILMPKDSQILSFQRMNNKYYIWVLVDPNKICKNRKLYIYGTGHLIENIKELNYISTANDNIFVWHLFEYKEKINE